MKKIPSLFKRDYEGTRLVYNEVVDGCEWVLKGEGIATEKIDGTSCLVRDGKLYKRYDAKNGKKPPEGWEPCEAAPNEFTGHWPGWIAVGDGPEDRWHRRAVEEWGMPPDWTYELVGPKVQGNPYGLDRHFLRRHGFTLLTIPDEALTFDGLRQWLAEHDQIEGIVWWRNPNDPDCEKCKLKRRDFGLPWPARRP